MAEVTTLADLEAEPHAAVFREDPRTVRLRLGAGDRIPRHTHPGTRVVCHVIEGRLSLDLDGESLELSAGDVARFDGDREISPLAREDATAVLVFAPAEASGGT